MKEYRVLLLVLGIISVRAQTKMETLKTVPEFSEFVKAIERLSQTANLENRNIQTLVIPVNSAFDMEKMGSNDNEKTLCLQTHMLSGTAFTNAKINTDLNAQKRTLKADTKRGGSVFFHKQQNDLYVDDAKIVGPEKELTVAGYATVIHGIDKVLCPFYPSKFFNQDPSVSSFLKDKDGTVFNDMFKAFVANKPGAQLLSQITYEGTFLAPLDSQVNQPGVKDYLEEALTELKKKENVDKLEKILETHVIDGQVLPSLPVGDLQTFHKGDKLTISKKTVDGVEEVTIKAGETEAQVVGKPQRIGNGLVYYVNTILDFMYLNIYGISMTNAHLAQYKTLFPHTEDSFKNTLKDGNKTYTLFAVDNPGVKDNDKITKLQQDKAELTKMMKMALVPQALTHADLLKMDGQKLTSINGDELEVSVNGDVVYISGGGVKTPIIERDLKAVNGWVQVVGQMLGVGSTTVYDILGQDQRLSEQKDLFIKYGFDDYLKTATNLTVIAAYDNTFKDARRKSKALDELLTDTIKKTDTESINIMKNFLSLFILSGKPDIAQGMPKTDLTAYAYPGYKGKPRTVGFKGDVSGVDVMYKAQTVGLDTPLYRPAANGQVVITKDVIIEESVKVGAIQGAATAKLHTGLAIVFTLFMLKFWL